MVRTLLLTTQDWIVFPEDQKAVRWYKLDPHQYDPSG